MFLVPKSEIRAQLEPIVQILGELPEDVRADIISLMVKLAPGFTELSRDSRRLVMKSMRDVLNINIRMEHGQL